HCRQEHAKYEQNQKTQFDYIFESDNHEALVDNVAKLGLSLSVEAPWQQLSSPGILSDKQIFMFLESPQGIRIEGLSPEQVMKHIRGCTMDLTLSRKFFRPMKMLLRGKALDFASAKESDVRKRFREQVADADGIFLKAGEFILAGTNEKLLLTDDIAGFLTGRSSYSRMGVSVTLTQDIVQPGHEDIIALQIRNNLPFPIVIYPDTPVAQIAFCRLVGSSSSPYGRDPKSKYQGSLNDIRSRFYEDEVYAHV
ncbi:unnamed protein product, partial [marine sediment metagenome]